MIHMIHQYACHIQEVEPEKCDDKENQTEEPDNENQTEEPDTAQEKGEDNPGYSPQVR